MTPYEKYLQQFKHLHVNRKGNFIAPHKPILLIAVMDYLADSPDVDIIPPSKRLNELFKGNWNLFVPNNSPYKPTLVTPFIHMSYEPFWHLQFKDDILSQVPMSSLIKLQQYCLGAKLDDELLQLIRNDDIRDLYRTELLKIYKLKY